MLACMMKYRKWGGNAEKEEFILVDVQSTEKCGHHNFWYKFSPTQLYMAWWCNYFIEASPICVVLY